MQWSPQWSSSLAVAAAVRVEAIALAVCSAVLRQRPHSAAAVAEEQQVFGWLVGKLAAVVADIAVAEY